MTIAALISQTRGVAAFDSGERISVMTLGAGEIGQCVDGLPVRVALGNAEDIEYIGVEDLEELRRHLVLRRDQGRLLEAALVLIDRSEPEEIRRLAAAEFERLYRDETWQWVEGVLLSRPAPESADFRGAAERCERRGDLFLEVERLQPRVVSVRNAWLALPQSLFGSAKEMSQARAEAVRKGAFRALVRGEPWQGVVVGSWSEAWCALVAAASPEPSMEGFDGVALPSPDRLEQPQSEAQLPGSLVMPNKRKRISRRRLAGQRVLSHVPTYSLESGAHKPHIAARRYIAENGLTPPALLHVRRNEHTSDSFFWGEKGLFSAHYAEENHFLFPSLRVIVEKIGEEVLFEGIEAVERSKSLEVLVPEDFVSIEAQ